MLMIAVDTPMPAYIIAISLRCCRRHTCRHDFSLLLLACCCQPRHFRFFFIVTSPISIFRAAAMLPPLDIAALMPADAAMPLIRYA